MSEKKNEPYCAPPAEAGRVDAQSAPDWGDDAKEIAREAGLGSYGPEFEEAARREDALLAALDSLHVHRVIVTVLGVAFLTLAALLAFLLLAGRLPVVR